MKTHFSLKNADLGRHVEKASKDFHSNGPFPFFVIDDFLPIDLAEFMSSGFPGTEHQVWLDWRNRSGHQYGKQGVGSSERFDLLEPRYEAALQEFNSWRFLKFLEQATGYGALLPDPYFTGGGLHQIIEGGILDVHTDFNRYSRLNIYRQLNVILYLTKEWEKGDGGELELWDGVGGDGRCVHSIAPKFNRLVAFKTDKTSFHGHPNEWKSKRCTRRSIALYYYTAQPFEGFDYNGNTDFIGKVYKETEADLQRKEEEVPAHENLKAARKHGILSWFKG